MTITAYAKHASPWGRYDGYSRADVLLSRSESFAIADAIEPFVKKHRSQRAAAAEIGLSNATLHRAMSRSASLSLSRGTLDNIMRITGLDTTKFGA